MIKNNKGFAITEVLIISTVLIGVLIFMYSQFKNINRSYQYSFKYDTVQGMYLANNIINFINEEDYDNLQQQLNQSGLSYLDITDCNQQYFTKISLCKILFEKSEIEQIIFTKEDLNNLKSSMFDLPEDMKQYINNITPINSPNDHRIVIKYKNETYASMRFNKGENYISGGLIVHLDALDNTGSGHTNNTNIWRDKSGNNNDAILYNNPTWNVNSIVFNGIDNYANIENTRNVAFNSGITIETRVKILSFTGKNSQGNIEYIGNNNNSGFGISYSSTNNFYTSIYLSDNTHNLTSEQINRINEYHTITMTYDNEKLKLYEDGKLTIVLNIEGEITPSNIPITIGGNKSLNTPETYSNVEIQNVLIYNRALTEYEVLKNYQVDELRY